MILNKYPHPITGELEKIAGLQSLILTQIIEDRNKQENEIFEVCLRTYATPPIVGEITKGKIKWRGIVKCSCPELNECWLEQRGQRISPTLQFVTPFFKSLKAWEIK